MDGLFFKAGAALSGFGIVRKNGRIPTDVDPYKIAPITKTNNKTIYIWTLSMPGGHYG